MAGKIFVGGVACALAVAAGSASATSVDLVNGNTGSLVGSVGGTAFFDWVDSQSTGTGVIQSFVRLQANGTEQGYNTDGRPLNGFNSDTNNSPQFTRSLQVGQVPIVNIHGGSFYQFLLDINQQNNNPNNLLSLDDVKIFVEDAPDLLGNINGFPNPNPTWAMQGPDDVQLDYNRNPGSGAGDMFMYIPVADLGNISTKFVYLFSHFGDSHATNDGFEEWATLNGPTIPLPTAGAMGLAGLAGVFVLRRRSLLRA